MLSSVEFVVIESEGHALLGQETAVALEVLKMGPQVNLLEVSADGPKGAPSIFVRYKLCT